MDKGVLVELGDVEDLVDIQGTVVVEVQAVEMGLEVGYAARVELGVRVQELVPHNRFVLEY